MSDIAHTGPGSKGSPNPVAFGPFVLDASQRRLTRDGRDVAVQPKTLDLLIHLVERAGDLVTRDELMDALWPDVVVSEGSLVRCVREARRVLGDDAARPRYIATVRKGGYRFIAPVETLDSAGHSMAPPSRPRFRVAVTLLVALAIVVPALVYLAGPEWGFSGPDEGDNSMGNAPPSLDVSAINADRRFRLGEQALALRSSGIAEARRHFELALEENPGHAPAMAGMAMALSLSGPRPPDAELQRRILSLSQRALDIEPGLPLAHAAVGMMYAHFPRHYSRAEEAFRKALAGDPTIIEALSGLATIQSSKGRLQEAVTLHRRALAINPTHTTVTGNLAIVFSRMGRYEEALDLVEALEELPAAQRAMVYPKTVIYRTWGKPDELIRVQVQALQAWPDSNFMARSLAETLASLGDRETALYILDHLGETCESPEARFFREASLRHALGGPPAAVLHEWQDTIAPFANRDGALMWRGRLALADNDPEAVVQALEPIFPDPGSLVGWQGDYTAIADGAQTLAWAEWRLGNETRARTYLEAVQRGIDQRRAAGMRSYYPIMLVEARNAALIGDEDRALSLLQRAVGEGWLDLPQLDDRRWAGPSGRDEFAAIRDRMNDRARSVLQAMLAGGLHEDLLAALDNRPLERDCAP